MLRRGPRFNRQAAARVKQIIETIGAQKLSGLTPDERAAILNNILVRQNPQGSSLKITIASEVATAREFGTVNMAARPWVKPLQRALIAPIRANLARMLTSVKTRKK